MLVQPATEAKEHLAEIGGAAISNPVAQAAIWYWFNTNLDKQIVKIWIVKVRVRDLRILFQILAGPER